MTISTTEPERPASGRSPRQEEEPWTAEDESMAKALLRAGLERLLFRGMEHEFYTPLRRLFTTMDTELGDCPSAQASSRRSKTVLEFGRRFMKEHANTPDFVADLAMHELGHDALLHLHPDTEAVEKDYPQNVRNLAEDALINVLNHRAKSSSFMEHFYRDEGATAFLRPNSRSPALSEANDAELPAAIDRNGKAILKPGEFYRKLYTMEITLEESLAFFEHYYPNEDPPSLGSHGNQSASGNNPSEGEGEGGSASSSQNGGNEGQSSLGRSEAEAFLRALGIELPSNEDQDNFAEIINEILAESNQGGSIRTDIELAPRLPSRFKLRDLIQTEKHIMMFAHDLFGDRDFWILIDVSGSIGAYYPFLLGLVRGLNFQDRPSACFVCADGIQEIDVDELQDANVGMGTQGEVWAQKIAEGKPRDVVILTDNLAGDIVTPIEARIYLCIVPGGVESGSFADEKVVPNCKKYKLRMRP